MNTPLPQARARASEAIQTALAKGSYELDLSSMQLDAMPAELADATQLRRLDLGGNRLKEIPSEII